MHRRLQIANEVPSKASLTSPGCVRDWKRLQAFQHVSSKSGGWTYQEPHVFFKQKNRLLAFLLSQFAHPKSRRKKTLQLMGWISEDHVLSYLEEEGLRIEPQWSHGLWFLLWVSGVWVETAKGERGQWPCWHEWHEGGTIFWKVFSIHVLLVSISPERMPVTRIITNFTRGFLISRPSWCSTGIQNPGWLFDIGDFTSQLYGDYNKPIYGSL